MKTKNFVPILLCVFTTISALFFWKSHRPTPLFPGMKLVRYRFRTNNPTPLEPAVVALEARVKRTPSAADLAELASLYFHQGHVTGDLAWYDKAEEAATHSLRLLPSPNGSQLTLAKVADARHDFDLAIRLAKDCLKNRPTSGAFSVIVSSNLAQGNLDEASHWADAAVDYLPDMGAYLMRGLVLAARGRDEEAAFDFQHAVKVEDLGNYDESARLRAVWGRFLSRHGDYANAEALFEESLRIVPGNHLALSLWGDMELIRGNYPKAQKLLMDAFTASKQMRYLIHYARAKALGGDPQGADEVRATAEKMIRDELKTGKFGHRLELVELLLDRGGEKNTHEAVQLALEENKIRHSAEAEYFLARSLWADKRPEEALEPMREVLRTGVRDPEYYAMAALIERSRGNTPHALFYQAFAGKLKPSTTFLPGT